MRPYVVEVVTGRVFFTCEAEEATLPQVLKVLGEYEMIASANIPHSGARYRSTDIVRYRTDLWQRTKQKSSVKMRRGSTSGKKAGLVFFVLSSAA